MGMERIEPEVWALISADLARAYGVLPLGQNDGRIRLVANRNLPEDERESLQSKLELCLGGPVVVEDIKDHSEIGFGFEELLERYYPPLPTMSMNGIPEEEYNQIMQGSDAKSQSSGDY